MYSYILPFISISTASGLTDDDHMPEYFGSIVLLIAEPAPVELPSPAPVELPSPAPVELLSPAPVLSEFEQLTDKIPIKNRLKKIERLLKFFYS